MILLHIFALMEHIAYYRVSTSMQGTSGLGLEAQAKQVKDYVGGELLAEYTEIESGKNDERKQLALAIEHCKQTGARLVVAKLDRLSRNLTFISTLMDAGIKFVCADMPEANEFTIHIFGALAQQERKMISERTKRALQALKDRGVKLGNPENLTREGVEKSVRIRKEKAKNNVNTMQARAYARSLRNEDKTFKVIAAYLNANGFKTAKGKMYTEMQVLRLLK